MARGNIDIDQLQDAVRQGAGTKLATTDGSFTAGNVPKYDTDGKIIDSGSAPGGGGGGGDPWLSITDPTTITFSWRNQGGASVTSRTGSIFLLAPAVSGDSLRCREIAAPSTPWSITIGIIPLTTGQSFNQCGLYVTDGIKLVAITIGSNSNTNGMNVSKFNSVTSFNGNYASIQMNPPISPLFLKVVNDGTNLIWHWSPNGLDFVQLDSHLIGDWLGTIAAVGFYADSNNGVYAAGVLLVSWVQGTS